jgi:hypothetical protein
MTEKAEFKIFCKGREIIPLRETVHKKGMYFRAMGLVTGHASPTINCRMCFHLSLYQAIDTVMAGKAQIRFR